MLFYLQAGGASLQKSTERPGERVSLSQACLVTMHTCGRSHGGSPFPRSLVQHSLLGVSV